MGNEIMDFLNSEFTLALLSGGVIIITTLVARGNSRQKKIEKKSDKAIKNAEAAVVHAKATEKNTEPISNGFASSVKKSLAGLEKALERVAHNQDELLEYAIENRELIESHEARLGRLEKGDK